MNKLEKKIGIITLHGYKNYGNKLQNYALQEVVKSIGFALNTIVIEDVILSENNYVRKLKKITKMSFKNVCKKVFIKLKNRRFEFANKDVINNRTKCFKDFSKKYLNEVFFNNTKETLKKISNEYDYFITGSDQVWNTIYIDKMPIYFLTFTDFKKRIAYSPSFGISVIPLKYKDRYKVWLSEMKHISVREDAGAKIIYELIGKEVPVLVDPTLLLTKKQWLSISNISLNKPKGKYILTYFLGGISEEVEFKIKNTARNYNLHVVNLVDIKDKETYQTGPSEFIDYINSASVFFTDSFHGVVFSILMQTPFVVYKRISKSASMYSRIETLLKMFKFEYREEHRIKNDNQIFDIDFSHVGPILELERKKSLDYLKKALNVKE